MHDLFCRLNGIKQPTNIFIAIGPWEGQAQWDEFHRLVSKLENHSQAREKAWSPWPPFAQRPARNAAAAQRELFEKKKNDSNDVTCLMLATMSPELQKQFVDMKAYEIMTHLKEMF